MTGHQSASRLEAVNMSVVSCEVNDLVTQKGVERKKLAQVILSNKDDF